MRNLQSNCHSYMSNVSFFSGYFQDSFLWLSSVKLLSFLPFLSLFSLDAYGGMLFLLIMPYSRSFRLYSSFTFLHFFFFFSCSSDGVGRPWNPSFNLDNNYTGRNSLRGLFWNSEVYLNACIFQGKFHW